MFDKLARYLIESKNTKEYQRFTEDNLYALRVYSYVLAILGGVIAIWGFVQGSWALMALGICTLVFEYSLFSVLSRCSRILKSKEE